MNIEFPELMVALLVTWRQRMKIVNVSDEQYMIFEQIEVYQTVAQL